MKYLILGAGPAGLSFANALADQGVTDFAVLEKENEAGGLCRSAETDHAPLDLGGGHFLDVRRPSVTGFLFRFMPEEEWNLFERDSRIAVGSSVISHPFEANIWQMDAESQREYLDSIAKAGCNTGAPMPEKFVDWIRWKLGDKIAENYMLPYNRKVFGDQLNALGTYWLEKLPNVSYEETLLSCRNRKPYGTQPGHARFYYPKKYGYGELWLRMADRIGNRIEYGKSVCGIDFDSRRVRTADGSEYRAEIIVTTIPWTSCPELTGMPAAIRDSVSRLKHRSVRISYFPESPETGAQWIYLPDPALTCHRVLIRGNFCPGAGGCWTETCFDRAAPPPDHAAFSHVSEYAYPLNTVDKPQIMKRLTDFAKSRNVFPLGRWGEHQHYNSDVTVEAALRMADLLEK